MQAGIVKWFSDSKGFGFVSSSGRDFFIHFSEIQGDGFKSLQAGDKVSFEPSTSPKGPIARSLVKQN